MSQLRKPTAFFRASVSTTGEVVVYPEPGELADRKIHLYNGSIEDVEILLLPDAVSEVDFAGERHPALEVALLDVNLRGQDSLSPTLAGGKSLPFPLRVTSRQAILARAVRGIVELSVVVEYRRD